MKYLESYNHVLPNYLINERTNETLQESLSLLCVVSSSEEESDDMQVEDWTGVFNRSWR